MSLKDHYFKQIAREVSKSTRYFDRLIQLNRRQADSGKLLSLMSCAVKEEVVDVSALSDFSEKRNERTCIFLNGTFNYHLDIQSLLLGLHQKLSRNDRVISVVYNPYFAWLFRVLNTIGLRTDELPSVFITHTDLKNIARLSHFDVVRVRPISQVPFQLLGIGSVLNSILSILPVFRWLGLATIVSLRPIKPEKKSKLPSLSIVIPARNERGNIRSALTRMPDLGCDLEIVFIEGHSKDGTWEEILKVKEEFKDKFKIQAHQQTGKGKNDAVRLGFANASGHLLTILDADLTMPPELLERFYSAYCEGNADFINGSRLVYPMEGEAMRFLNRLGNIFFAKALSWVLDTKLGDSLCGTKLLAKHDYDRLVRWRKDFGDFDPFGDFELIFSAAILGLGVIDIPIRYLARTYGSTNISRFYHGAMLLRMTTIGFLRVKVAAGT